MKQTIKGKIYNADIEQEESYESNEVNTILLYDFNLEK